MTPTERIAELDAKLQRLTAVTGLLQQREEMQVKRVQTVVALIKDLVGNDRELRKQGVDLELVHGVLVATLCRLTLKLDSALKEEAKALTGA